MTDRHALRVFLDDACVAPEVFALRPDYRALLLVADGLESQRTAHTAEGDVGEAMLRAAEARARAVIGAVPVADLPQVASWREAYRSFGAKPQRTRNSLEALLRRVEAGLPRVNRLTDIYNAISVKHLLPLGGEDLHRYTGSPRLVRASGAEPFDTMAGGAEVVEHPDVGEVVWCDGTGVTCRRWNWRQARRTQLRPDTTAALFILDALDPVTDMQLHAAADDLAGHLTLLGSAVQTWRRVLSASDGSATGPGGGVT